MQMFFWREAWRSFRAHRGLALTTIFSLAAALTLCGIFLLVSWNAGQALAWIGDRREMIVYLNDDAGEAQVQALQGKIVELYGTSTFVSRAQAWEEFSAQVGDPEILKAVGTNPLPASLRVRLKPALQNFAAMEECSRQLEQFPEVEGVRFGGEWVRRLDALYAGARRGAIGVGVLVAIAIVFVLHNTLRLAVLARRQQVEIMTKLGASDHFIAMPFVVEALLETLVATLLALLLTFGLQQALAQRMDGVTFLPLSWSLSFVGGALLLAWGASAAALGRILRTVGV
jgi:cell division transport system permease protein